mmetsp:Transcript_24841/g.80228  ORF Transcript_24841/g.80228 Transcript_24841/m.80228 type:complete len:120 (+) Transcript_24841:63-422(+)
MPSAGSTADLGPPTNNDESATSGSGAAVVADFFPELSGEGGETRPAPTWSEGAALKDKEAFAAVSKAADLLPEMPRQKPAQEKEQYLADLQRGLQSAGLGIQVVSRQDWQSNAKPRPAA